MHLACLLGLQGMRRKCIDQGRIHPYQMNEKPLRQSMHDSTRQDIVAAQRPWHQMMQRAQQLRVMLPVEIRIRIADFLHQRLLLAEICFQQSDQTLQARTELVIGSLHHQRQLSRQRSVRVIHFRDAERHLRRPFQVFHILPSLCVSPNVSQMRTNGLMQVKHPGYPT